MTFLQIAMLFGLALLAVPVLIHLLNRSKARPLEWGAMRFLAASLCAQRRRLLLEEVLLMSLRCLALAAIILAMARPFLPSSATLPWVLLILLFGAAILSVGIAAAVWTSTRMRRRLMLFACAAILLATLGAMVEKWRQKSKWFTGNNSSDIVIIVDASDSMRISVDGRTNFERAKDDAISIVRASKAGDAIGLILAGPLPCPLARAPLSNRNELLAMIGHRDFQPIGGSFGALEALNAAAAMLAEGHNPVKRILVLSDQQGLGWDLQAEARWSFLSGNLKKVSGSPPKLIVRRYPLPSPTHNAAVASISFLKTAPVVGQSIGIEVKVLNGGEDQVAPSSVTLTVDGELVAQEPFLKELPPGGSENIRFEYRFKKSGRALVSASISCNDNLDEDNRQNRVIDVLEQLPVLVIDGAPATKRTQGEAEYIRLALAPGESAEQAAKAALLKVDSAEPDDAEQLELDKYRVIVIANPSRLPQKLASKLMDRVRAGGGLLIAPGDRSDASLSESFRSAASAPFLPAELAERKMLGDTPAHFSLKSFTHPALRLTADAPRSDASLAQVKAYWKLEHDKSDTSVDVGGLLDNGDPFIIERRYGRGRVMMSSFALGRDDSNFPRLRTFVPTLHELVYYLASGGSVDGNLKPGAELICEMGEGFSLAPLSSLSSTRIEDSGKPVELKVISPMNWPSKAEMLNIDKRPVIRCTETRCPGLYKILLGALGETPQDKKDAKTPAELPFTVLGDPEESKLLRISDEELSGLGKHIDLFVPATEEELMNACVGGTPGLEIWKHLIIAALLLLLGEVALTRWIAGRRRLHQAREVSFNNEDRNNAASAWKILTR